MKVHEFVNCITKLLEKDGYKCIEWKYLNDDDVDTAEIEDSFDNVIECGYKQLSLLSFSSDMLVALIGNISLTFDDVSGRRGMVEEFSSILDIFRREFARTILSIGWVKTFMTYIQYSSVASMDNRYQMMYMSIVRFVFNCNVDALRTLLFTDWDALAVELYETTSPCDAMMSHKDAVEYYSVYNRAISNYLIGYKEQTINILDENNAIECKALILRWFNDHSTNNVEDMEL